MLEAVHWPGDMKGPPANTPRCGYTGKDIACQDSGKKTDLFDNMTAHYMLSD
jgi:hypothetical protein